MRIRLSRTAWLILGIGVLVIALGSLYTVYSRQVSEQQGLEASLSAAQARWPQVISARQAAEAELTQWQDKLAEATSLLAKSEAKFPESAESIKYDELLFDIADVCDLEVMSLTASEPSDEKVEDVTYFITSFTVEVKGEVANILDFINTIVTHEDFITATVEVVNITVPEPLTEEEKEGLTKEEIKKKETPSATIKLVIYSYKGE
jgi:hypothetical protein